MRYQYPMQTCPACLGSKHRFLYAATLDEAARHFIPNPEITPERFGTLKESLHGLWKQNSVEILECMSCGFGFANPYVGGDSNFYTIAYQRSGYPDSKWEYDVTSSAISRMMRADPKRNIRLLELGAGNGAFLKKISPSLIPKDRIVCTEYSEYGISELRSAGFECMNQDIRTIPPSRFSAPFDLVCLFQVLEHMDRLEELFQALDRISTPNAHYFIAVPSNDRIRFNEQKKAVLDMPPNHIGRWTREAFRKLGDRHGLRILDHQFEPEPLIQRIRIFAHDRYYRQKTIPLSFANRLGSMKPGLARRSAELAILATQALYGLRYLKEIKKHSLGASQWLHFAKNA